MNRRNVFAFDTEIGADCPLISCEEVVAMLSACPAVLRNTMMCAPLLPDAVASGSVTVNAAVLVLHGYKVPDTKLVLAVNVELMAN